jgi:hypothetical protein
VLPDAQADRAAGFSPPPGREPLGGGLRGGAGGRWLISFDGSGGAISTERNSEDTALQACEGITKVISIAQDVIVTLEWHIVTYG